MLAQAEAKDFDPVKAIKEIADLFTPIGDGARVVTGEDPITGDKLSWGERGLSLLFIIPLAKVGKYGSKGFKFVYEGIEDANKIHKKADKVKEVEKSTKKASGANSIITPEMEEKILWGQRTNPNKNKIIGGHSPEISNNHPNYAVEEIILNPDGTRKLKYTTQFPDGNLSKIKTSTVFPEGWSDTKILESSTSIGNTPISVRSSDGATWHRSVIDGVEIDVIKRGNEIISAYPTGTVNGPPPVGFSK
ncbi:EndoU domain-containing protein [Listeria immobilis]|uniref:EndoU domain-containing protein n=1 Tax=Listeria immobilis TaxID=2713502 RepID=UPI00162982FD|nr:EndoU domain-containing protein [Listeria immobilis]MBC1516400.1 hypothetical protein [Listeria immobilis]